MKKSIFVRNKIGKRRNFGPVKKILERHFENSAELSWSLSWLMHTLVELLFLIGRKYQNKILGGC